MKEDLISMLEAFRMGHEDRAARLFGEYVEKKVYGLVSEDSVDENFGNVITRPVDGVAIGQPKIPNAYTTKKIPKKKKVLPKVNKGRYGTGYAPGSWHGDHASDHGGTGGGSDGGGGDGGGGGGE